MLEGSLGWIASHHIAEDARAHANWATAVQWVHTRDAGERVAPEERAEHEALLTVVPDELALLLHSGRVTRDCLPVLPIAAPTRRQSEAAHLLLVALRDGARVVGVDESGGGLDAAARRLEGRRVHHRDDSHEEDHAQHVRHHKSEEAHEQEEVPLPEPWCSYANLLYVQYCTVYSTARITYFTVQNKSRC